MTQGVPPPIPRRDSPVAAIPVRAMPLGPMGYSTPRSGRPGLISAIGIISIIVASLGLIGSLLQIFYVGIFYVLSQSMAATSARTVAPATPVSPIVAPATVASTAPIVSPLGFAPAERDVVIAGLKRVKNLSPLQVKHLEALLSASGKDVILLRGAKLTAGAVMKNVSDSGALPAANGDDGPTYFELGQGRIEVSDAQAAFFPTHGEVVRASADDGSANPGTIHPSGLSDAQIAAIVARVNQLSNVPPTPAQLAGFTKELKSTGQSLIYLSLATTPAAAAQQVTSVVVGTSGELNVYASGGWMHLSATGQATSSNYSTGMPTFKMDRAPTVILVCEAAASLLLAIYLLVIGILTLRQSPRGGRLHLIYALIKIPLACLAGVGIYLLFSTLFGRVSGTVPNKFALSLSIGMGVVVTCIYPFALLITLRTKSVREYYSFGVSE